VFGAISAFEFPGISAFEEIFEFNKYVGCCSSPLWENKEQKQNAFSHFPFIYFIKNMLIICVYNMYDGGGREGERVYQYR
jgi:hypothetical protein